MARSFRLSRSLSLNRLWAMEGLEDLRRVFWILSLVLDFREMALA